MTTTEAHASDAGGPELAGSGQAGRVGGASGGSGGNEAYSGSYYSEIEDGSLRSARAVMPRVLGLVGGGLGDAGSGAVSVVDVGCGVGSWLKGAGESGAGRVFGVDGDYVERDRLMIDAGWFSPVDLERADEVVRVVGERGPFELSMSLEVGEHLPAARASGLVGVLTSAAPVVLFSAAVPGQGGMHHINERWPGFWSELFEARGYGFVDRLRREFWHDERVEWWYRQNMLLYVRRDDAAAVARVTAGGERLSGVGERPMSLVHPEHFLRCADSLARSRARKRGLARVVAAVRGGVTKPAPLERP
ncbi:MAG: hypothetical protein AAF108_11650 [Planctomycetota bacterium]